MRIPTRPTELRTTLRDHTGQDDAPVFVYRFPTPAEEAELLVTSVSSLKADPAVSEHLAQIEDRAAKAAEIQRLYLEGEVSTNGQFGRYLCELFDHYILRIEHLVIGDVPFHRDRHLEDIPGAWKIEVAREIQQRVGGYLTEPEEGNSSSPSSSGVPTTPAAPTSATGAAVEDDAG